MVNDVMAGFGGALEGRLGTALLESPSLQQCAKTVPTQLDAVLARSRVNATWAVMKQAMASETLAESDQRRRNELFLGICEAVGVALRATDFHRLANDCVPGLFAELRLRLQAPINEQLQGWNTELQRAVEEVEAERRWARDALHLLEDLETKFADK